MKVVKDKTALMPTYFVWRYFVPESDSLAVLARRSFRASNQYKIPAELVN